MPMVDFNHPAGESLFWRISAAMERLVEQLENDSPVGLFFQKVDRDIAEAERVEQEAAMATAENEPPGDIHDFRRDRGYDERPITTNTGSTGGTGVSRILEGQQLLQHAGQQLDDLAGAVSGNGEPEEVQQILQAGQLEDARRAALKYL